jgi:hypothetical protein
MALLLRIACTHQTRHHRLVPISPAGSRPAQARTGPPLAQVRIRPCPGAARIKQASNRLIRDGPAPLTRRTLSEQESHAQASKDAQTGYRMMTGHPIPARRIRPERPDLHARTNDR